MNKNNKVYLNAKKLGLGCIAVSLGQSLCAAEAVEKISPSAGNLVSTQRDFGTFKVEVQAPANVDTSNLLRGVNGTVKNMPVNTSNSDLFSAVSSSIDTVRTKEYPDADIELTITRTGATPKSTSGYVDLYKSYYRWNKYVDYNNATYARNFHVNTVACFMRSQYGKWAPSLQSNGSWSNYSWIYGGGVHAMTASGYDNYKGCM